MGADGTSQPLITCRAEDDGLDTACALTNETSGSTQPQLPRGTVQSDQIAGSADELGEVGQDSRYGFGRLNVLRAIALARPLVSAETP